MTYRLATAWLAISVAVSAVQSQPVSEKAEALAAAARKGDAAAVTKLLDEGVAVNTRFRYGATALSYAADHGRLDVVKVLLARGADVNVKDTFYGATPLLWATSPATTRTEDHAAIVRLLLEHGATGKEEALTAAIAAGYASTVKALLDHGGLSGAALTDALGAATAAKRQDIVALLKAAGAKPPVEVRMDEARLANYVGLYRTAAGGELVVTTEGGRLFLGAGTSGPGPPQPIPLVARSDTDFVDAGGAGLRVTFRIEDGKVTAFTIGAASTNVYVKEVK